jgi:flagellar basal-body rod protein FlgB
MTSVFESVNQLQGAMSFHRHRHAVLAGNVANVDTPGFRSMDMGRPDFARSLENLTRTSGSHLAPGGVDGSFFHFHDDGSAPGLDGNTVSLERELAKVDANRVRYTTASELISRRTALLRYTASDGMG